MFAESIEIRPFSADDAKAVSALVRCVFDEHVSPSFEPAGIAEFYAYAAPEALVERSRTHRTFVAWRPVLSGVEGGARPVGVIEVRDTDHLSLLFVQSSHMGLGIATALLARAEEACRAAGRPALAVNSSLNARSFYERLGFVATDEPQHLHGFAFVPMSKRL